MMKTITAALLCAALLALTGLDASAQKAKRVPRFEDYPVKEIYRGKSAPLILNEDQLPSTAYYQATADGGVNFAGHYAVIQLTCGDTCAAADFLDLKTGKITPGDIFIYDWKKGHDAFRHVEFRRASRLIVYAGAVDETGPNGWHFFLFDNGKLKRLHTIVTDGDFTKPLAEWMK